MPALRTDRGVVERRPYQTIRPLPRTSLRRVERSHAVRPVPQANANLSRRCTLEKDRVSRQSRDPCRQVVRPPAVEGEDPQRRRSRDRRAVRRLPRDPSASRLQILRRGFSTHRHERAAREDLLHETLSSGHVARCARDARRRHLVSDEKRKTCCLRLRLSLIRVARRSFPKSEIPSVRADGKQISRVPPRVAVGCGRRSEVVWVFPADPTFSPAPTAPRWCPGRVAS